MKGYRGYWPVVKALKSALAEAGFESFESAGLYVKIADHLFDIEVLGLSRNLISCNLWNVEMSKIIDRYEGELSIEDIVNKCKEWKQQYDEVSRKENDR